MFKLNKIRKNNLFISNSSQKCDNFALFFLLYLLFFYNKIFMYKGVLKSTQSDQKEILKKGNSDFW